MNVFCELAHGSPIRRVSGFKHPKEFYQKIAECFDISVQDILFCTLNTRDVDMSRLLRNKPSHGDFIYVHLKGRSLTTEILCKDLGSLTLIAGTYFIYTKAPAREGATSRNSTIEEGDHIQMINGESLEGRKAVEV